MVLILNCGSSKIDFIEEIVDGFCDFRTVPILDFNEQDLKNYTGVIISGAPLLITEQNISPFLEKISWIKNTLRYNALRAPTIMDMTDKEHNALWI